MSNYLWYSIEAAVVMLGAIWLALDAVQGDPDGYSYGIAAIGIASLLAGWLICT